MNNGVTSLPELPKGWVWTMLSDVAKVVTGNTPSKKDPCNYGDHIPFVKPPELRDGVIAAAEDSLSAKGAKVARILPVGSVLVSCIGSLGKTGINKIPVAFNQQINAVIFPVGIAPKYGFYYCQTLRTWLNSIASATTVTIVNKSRFETAPLPLPPLPEQYRMVAKIEELFTRLDAGIEALNEIKAQLKRYRQSVLKHAFEGKLTAEWREAHKDELEPASVLLKRIKQEHQKTAKGKYGELPLVDTSDLPELPEAWEWARIGNVSEVIQYGTSEKANIDSSGIPVIRMGNIQDGKLVLDELKYFPQGWPELGDFILQEGDVLFNRTNSVDLVGKTAVYKSFHPRAVFASYLIRVRVNEAHYSADMLSFFINSLYGRRYIASVASQQVGQANVNGTKLSLMPIPVPPSIEQGQLVAEIEHRFSIADQIEETVDRSLKQAERLRQSILKRAFEGKLIPQDPNDEPVEKLLERIKAERARQIVEKRVTVSKAKRRQGTDGS